MKNPFSRIRRFEGFKYWMDKMFEAKSNARKLQRDNPKPQFRFIDPSEVHRIDDGLLNIDEEHTGEEIQNSRGFYKRMSMEEYRKHFSSMTDQQIKYVQIINNKDVQQTKESK